MMNPTPSNLIKNSVIIILLLLTSIKLNCQTIFLEDFGQTTTRQTSIYMPTGSSTFAAPNEASNEKQIVNNHYAVTALDSDGDSIDNTNDLDDDNDGILDTLESNGNDPDGDEDNDGILNYLDNSDGTPSDGSTGTDYTDTNNDGIPDVYDFDGDGIANHLDLDSDNDGIYDILEAGGIDSNNDGIADNIDDLDNDGLADIYDDSCQSPAVPASTKYATAFTASQHFTNTGNAIGNPDNTYASGPTGWPGSNPYYLVLDFSETLTVGTVLTIHLGVNSGTASVRLRQTDSSGNNGVNYQEYNVNASGPLTFSYTITYNDTDYIKIQTYDYNARIYGVVYGNAVSGPSDCSGSALTPLETTSGTPDFLNIDSDGDGCNDVLEAGFTDANNDGEIDGSGYSSKGIVLNSNGYTGTTASVTDNTNSTVCLDSDNDGLNDIDDLDDDNDGILDSIENSQCGVDGAIMTTVFSEDFGNQSTTNGTKSITSEYTNYNYYESEVGTVPTDYNDGGSAPQSLQDGRYTIFNDIQYTASWAATDWQTIGDHTNGSATPTAGRMAIFNANESIAGLEFYRRTLKNIVAGAPINASYWAMNIYTTPGGSSVIKPNITVQFIQGGSEIYSFDSGDIDPVAAGNFTAWKQFSNQTVFIPSSNAPIDIVFINNTIGGLGNDLAIDDILITQSFCDEDGDSIPSYLDLDSDNDGITDVIEAGGIDANKDGLADDTNNNANNTATNGIPTSAGTGTTPTSTDTDGIPDYLDIDADNDGIPDNIEGQPSRTYVAPSPTFTDLNSNGLDDIYETGGIVGIDPVNTDIAATIGADTIPDYLDSDSDGDGINDIIENGNTNNSISGIDTDADGLDDAFEGANVNDSSDVNDEIDIPNKTSLGDLDDDFTTFGDLDYRDISDDGIVMITQVYHLGIEKWIEITNIHSTKSIAANLIKIQLHKDQIVEPTDLTPTATFTITSPLAAGESVLIRNTSNVINATAAVIVDNNFITDFDSADDIISLSPNNDSNSWKYRYDVISELEDNTSYVRIDETLLPNTVYTSSEWILFLDDRAVANGGLDPYRDLASGGPQRHPHDPLISEIESANSEANTRLGKHRINITTRTASNWSNGYPDRSRFVVIDQDYEHLTDRLSARKLTVNTSNKLSVKDNLLVVTNDVLVNGEIRLVGTSQLVQTHKNATKVSGLGKLLVDQNSTVPSFYRYNYMSSPVTTNGSTYSLKSVFKDGTIPLGASTAVKDITFVGGYDGNHNTDPISLARYWIYTYSPSSNGRSNWAQRTETETIAAGDGFIFKGPGVAQNYTFTGTPNDGNLDASNIGAGQSYLVGNPFSSAISVKKFIEDNEGSLTGTLYFWQHTSETESSAGTSSGHNFAGYIGGYATRTIDLGVAANAYTLNQSNGTSGTGTGYTYDTPGLYIPIGQGFFIEGDATGGSVVFNNSQREFIDEAAGVSVFFKGEETASKNTGNHKNAVPIIKLGMDYLNEEEISIHRQIGISFNPNNSFDYEKGYDAAIYDVSTTDFYWKFPSDDTKYVISGVQEIDSDLQVPLEITMAYSGEVSITVDEIKNVSENVYVIDKTTGVSYEVINNKAVLNLNEGVYTNRFVLAFKTSTALSIDDLIDDTFTNIYADNKNHQLVISKNVAVNITNVQLYNILGEKVSLWKIKEQKNSYQLDIKKQIPTGVYIVKLNTNKGESNKKIIIE